METDPSECCCKQMTQVIIVAGFGVRKGKGNRDGKEWKDSRYQFEDTESKGLTKVRPKRHILNFSPIQILWFREHTPRSHGSVAHTYDVLGIPYHTLSSHPTNLVHIPIHPSFRTEAPYYLFHKAFLTFGSCLLHIPLALHTFLIQWLQTVLQLTVYTCVSTSQSRARPGQKPYSTHFKPWD